MSDDNGSREEVKHLRALEKLKGKMRILQERFAEAKSGVRQFLEALLDGFVLEGVSWPDFVGYLSIDRLDGACPVDGGVVVLAYNNAFNFKMLYFFQDNGKVRCINYWRTITIDIRDCYPPMLYGDGNLIFMSLDKETYSSGSAFKWNIHTNTPGNSEYPNLKGHLQGKILMNFSRYQKERDGDLFEYAKKMALESLKPEVRENRDVILRYLDNPSVRNRSLWISPVDNTGTYVSTNRGVFFLARRFRSKKRLNRNRIWWLRPPMGDPYSGLVNCPRCYSHSIYWIDKEKGIWGCEGCSATSSLLSGE